MQAMISVLDKTFPDEILDQAKQILFEVGYDIQGVQLRKALLEFGLRQTADGRIKFSPDVVDKAIRSAPETFTLYNREGRPHADIGGYRVHFVPGSSGLRVLDHRTGVTRTAKTADFVEYIRLADGLKNIDYLATAFSTDDIVQDIADAWRLYLSLTNSYKPVVSGAFTEHGVPRMVEMMQVFRTDRRDLAARPLSIFTITPTGNFRYGEDSCQNLLDCVRWGIPIEITPVTLMGLIAPVTIVEATIFHTADVLAGLTMAQIIKPGTPVLFGGAPAAFNMQTATAPMAAVEAQKLNMAYIQVAKHLGLPTQAYMGLSDAKAIDAQAGAETFGSALLAALAGVNSVSGPGMLDYVLVFSLAKLVLDNEYCGQALHFVREIKAVDDVPALELARQVIAEDHLITAEHTLRYWPEHFYLPGSIIDRKSRDVWVKEGSVELAQRLQSEVERMLAAYVPVETDERAAQELMRILGAGQDDDLLIPDVPEAKSPPVRQERRQRRARPRR